MKLFPLPTVCVAMAVATVLLPRPVDAQKMATPAGEAPGPWILGTVGVGKGEDPKTPKTTALKGLAIKVGKHAQASVAYDLDLCRVIGAWKDKFTTPMNLMSRGEYPTAMNEPILNAVEGPGLLAGDTKEPWKDPRSEAFGPLPVGQPRFKGFFVSGDRTVLRWDFGGTEVLETPWYETAPRGGDPFAAEHYEYVVRTFSIAPSPRALLIPLLTNAGPANQRLDVPADLAMMTADALGAHSLSAENLPAGARWKTIGNVDCLWIPPLEKRAQFRLAVSVGAIGAALPNPNGSRLATDAKFPTPEEFVKGGPAHWTQPVVTAGELSTKTDEAYVVDTIKLPDPNPWGAPLFVGGFDFFPDGRAAVCTFHGDVFVVSGIDEKLEKVTWRRFASGLYHALGLKIVNGDIYVTCRDGLWRLKDLNNDGEADAYELFNGDVKVTKSFHEFVFDLQTDPAGNFYFAKAGPVKNGGRGFDEIMAHHGSLLRVSPDGSKLDVVATGFRAPNGIGCGPDGQLTTGDNEGTWTPVCKINWIQPGGFYGVVPLAHHDPVPTDYDRPLCWLPKRVDNSGGSQVWVTSDKWGPWKDQLLHLSYGTCSVFGVMKEPVSGIAGSGFVSNKSATSMQGGVTRFPVNFQSGVMRARFSPVDGQLYVAGLRGWQTTGVKNGAFQRVRYTGAPVRMPIGLHATKKGVRLDFTCALDPATAGDPQNWNVEVWNYLWSSAYGSPELSTLEKTENPGDVGKDGDAQFSKAQMGQRKHDALTVKAATLSPDKKSVFLEIPDIKPVMQMAIKFGIQSADGAELRSEVVNTIHALLEE